MAQSTRTKIADLKTKSDDELKTRLAELRKEQFNLRLQKATGQLSKVNQVRAARREIAQIQTLANERLRKSQKKAA
ncbi:MAG: 50S ribosomal protein L29 [Proteobacteria bacterium]|nr:50S ribosomal protein L29 [Pseudomonadota bacterium]